MSTGNGHFDQPRCGRYPGGLRRHRFTTNHDDGAVPVRALRERNSGRKESSMSHNISMGRRRAKRVDSVLPAAEEAV